MSNMKRWELYRLVWEKPMKRIAATYGISAVRLANACDEYEIPRPPAGYWQKLEYGKPVAKPVLDDHSFSNDETVIIRTRESK